MVLITSIEMLNGMKWMKKTQRKYMIADKSIVDVGYRFKYVIFVDHFMKIVKIEHICIAILLAIDLIIRIHLTFHF